MAFDPNVFFLDSARQVCLEVAQDIVEEIKRSPETPEVTSRMKNGYRASAEGTGALIQNVAAPYWDDVEYGHNVVVDGKVVGYQAPQPHVRPSIEIIARRNLE